MKEFAELALNTAQAQGATYGDIRILHTDSERIATKNGNVESLITSEDRGFGVRVLVSGSWGFASSADVTKAAIEETSARAVQIAKASALLKQQDVTLADEPAHVDSWKTPYERDPFTVPIEEKIDLLLQIDTVLRRVKKIGVAEGVLSFWKEKTIFANTEGSFIEQELLRSGAGYTATAIDNGEMQIRSYPGSHRGLFMGKGYELIHELSLLEQAERVGEEAVALLSAPTCPSGKKDIILNPNQLFLQIHESIGHPTELDRVLGTEANFAGTSFATPEKLHTLQYSSDIVTIRADTLTPGGLATAGYDDDGVAAQQWYLIKDGLFVGYLTNRETAHVIGETRSRGCNRADGWNRLPIIRMPNISLMPGTWTLDDLIADTDDGLLFDCNKSWSIDDKRVNFQFATEVAWEIKNGKKGQMFKNPTYQGITTEFWNACDGICNQDHFVLWGTPNCGKGQPGQTAAMSHGCAPARFRNVTVGVA
ncbi:peptidase C69 [candidate division KSB3 bacterium]|uniref:Peptidase C69 n=1 Tax=candidate division KSB3 bacterium TaxID=2044937 RepID=A0A2G6KBT3_9BACT|nr:MAG: peptidase C69 [candidate division KSB3 bacterium]